MASQFGLGQPKPVSCALGSHLESFSQGNCVLISKARLQSAQRSEVREGVTMNVARRKNFRVSDGSYDSKIKLQPHADVATSISRRIFKQWHCGGINDSVS